MAINTYTLVKQALPAVMDVATAQLAFMPSGDMDDVFRMAEERIINDIMDRGGVRAWESTLNGTMSASGTLALPSGYMELKHAYINTSPVQWLERRNAEDVYRSYPLRSAEGKPRCIAREGEQFIFGPFPDAQYLVTGIHYARPSTVVGSGNTTFTGVFANNPTILIYAAASEAETFLKRQKQRQEWEARYGAVLDRIVSQEMRERWSGSNLMVTTR